MFSGKRAAFVTLGCKVNQYETETIKKDFFEHGYSEAEFEEPADVYVVNSCTVTSIADRKTRNMIRRTKKLNPDSIVVVTGCYAQTNSEDIMKIEGVDLVVGNREKENLYSMVEKHIESGEISGVSDIFAETKYREIGFATLREMARAYIKIQDGCDNFCSYCKIPFARGHKRSRDIKNIIEEAAALGAEGYKEIILIGINIGAYGEDLETGITLENVIEEVGKIDTIERIRIGSIYPDRITDSFIEMMKNNGKFMPHLHISMQAADDTILRLMRRKYTVKNALDNIERIRKVIPSAAFTGDIITGFPGEKEENHRNTYENLKKCLFNDLHIFPYSDRENTEASRYEGKVSAAVKKIRTQELEELREEMALTVRKEMVGSIVKVLLEEIRDGSGYGYAENYMKVKINSTNRNKNEIMNVLITGLEGELLLGEEKES